MTNTTYRLPQDGYAIHHQITCEGDREDMEAMVNIGAPLEDLVAYVAREAVPATKPSWTTHTYTIVTVEAGKIVERGEGVTVKGTKA